MPYCTLQSAELHIIPLNTADSLYDNSCVTKLAASFIAEATQPLAGEASSHKRYIGALPYIPSIIDCGLAAL